MAIRMLSREAAFGLGLEGCRMASESWEETVWSGKELRSGEVGCAAGEALGALLQALLWFWGLRGMPGILPPVHILLKIPVR